MYSRFIKMLNIKLFISDVGNLFTNTTYHSQISISLFVFGVSLSSQPQLPEELYRQKALTLKPDSRSSSTKCEPINPSAPVTSALWSPFSAGKPRPSRVVVPAPRPTVTTGFTCCAVERMPTLESPAAVPVQVTLVASGGAGASTSRRSPQARGGLQA